MNQSSKKVTCPNCGTAIDVNDLLYHQLDDELKKKYNDQLAQERKGFAEAEKELKAQQDQLEQQRKKHNEQVTTAIEKGLKQEKLKLEESLKQKLREEQEDQIATLEKELSEKSLQVKALNKSRAEVEKLKREKEELKEQVELEAEKKLSHQLSLEKEKIRKTEEEKARLNLSEKEQVIQQLKEQLQEAQRKAEQGSTQLQGEVQELAIEDWLQSQFPLDTVEEIKKGERGADCLQTVNTLQHQNCGTIYYESKRTKAFQPNWIEKFKQDIRDRNADIGVLVTEAMPKDMDRLGLLEGIWVCSFDEFKGLCTVLRESVIRLSTAVNTQENKGDKMGMLYDFLTGNEFRMQVEAIVEGFTQMKTDLDSEKRSMQMIWKKREKQIEKVLLNTNYMYGSIKGIAGNAIQTVPLLELPEADD
jgi:hypothetical protein